MTYKIGQFANVIQDGYFLFSKPTPIIDIASNGDGSTYYFFTGSNKSFTEIIPGSTLQETAKFLGVNNPANLAEVYARKKRIDQIKTTWTGLELSHYVFPPPNYIIPKYVTEGLNIFAGRPKVGKSWLGMQFCKNVGGGTPIFGETVTERKCFYLAMEDKGSRLQERLKIQKWTKTALGNVTFELRLPRKLDLGGLKWLQAEIEQNGYQFVVIDTISRAMSSKVKQNQGEDINKLYEQLQQLAFDFDCPILLIDHHNKIKDATDAIDAVLGSTSKVGVADNILGMFKKHHTTTADLKIVGRDSEDQEVVIEFDKATCEWGLVGDKQAVILNASQKKAVKAIQSLGNNATFAEIQKETEWSKGYVSKILNALIDDGKLTKPNDIYIISPYCIL